jgi:hypothetical protein
MLKKHFFYYPDSPILNIIIYRLRIRVSSVIRQLYQFIFYRRILQKTKKLQGEKNGQKAFVFANGASMNKLDPLKIKSLGYDVFAVNGYMQSKFGALIPPTHYILSDPSWFNGAIGNDQARDPERNDKVIDLLGILGVKLFIPLNYMQFVQHEELYGFCDIENLLSGNAVDISKPRGYLSASAYKALAIALYLGYDHVYICGIDNNYIKFLEVDSENRLSYQVPHIGDSSRVYLDDLDFCQTVGEYMYREHTIFENFRKFPHSRITNLDPTSLVCEINKRHDLDIYLDESSENSTT